MYINSPRSEDHLKRYSACTVIPRLTSDPANKFSADEEFPLFSDSANECFSGCAR
jgi:hypothetical protein